MKVFVVADEGGEREYESVANLSNDKGSKNPIGTFMTPSVPQFHSDAENINVMYSPI